MLFYIGLFLLTIAIITLIVVIVYLFTMDLPDITSFENLNKYIEDTNVIKYIGLSSVGVILFGIPISLIGLKVSIPKY